MFDYPLTLVELDRWLYMTMPETACMKTNSPIGRLSSFQKLLETDEKLREKIETKNGFYFFSGRENSIQKRLRRYLLAEKKWKKAKRFIAWLSGFPYVRFIGICNTLGFSNASENSDIDLLIIAADKHLWTTRFWTVSAAKLLGVRPTPEYTKDRFCFSFFLSDEHLNISSLRIADEDVYLRYWLATVVPVYDQDECAKRLYEENVWIRDRLPHFQGYKTTLRRRVEEHPSVSITKRIAERCQKQRWESVYRAIQTHIMPERLKMLAQQGIGVIMNDRMLKFHDRDRREQIQKIWEERRKRYDTT